MPGERRGVLLRAPTGLKGSVSGRLLGKARPVGLAKAQCKRARRSALPRGRWVEQMLGVLWGNDACAAHGRGAV